MKSSSWQIRGRDLPLWLWGIGFFEFVWQGNALPAPPVGWFSWGAFALIAAISIATRGRSWAAEAHALWRDTRRRPVYLALFGLFAASLGVALKASLLPPHLPQEYDAINYQLGVPHQLLIRHSLDWINWSVADLWPMALQWGMAPYSFAFSTVNKVPEVLLAAGAAACLYRLTEQLAPRFSGRAEAALPMLAFFGAHGVAIQLGTAMVDLPLLYCLLLALSALLEERLLVAALSLAVYTASKSFHLFQVAPLLLGGLAWSFFGRSRFAFRTMVVRFILPFTLFAGLLLARPVITSFNATGTPLFPFAPCLIHQGYDCRGPLRDAVDRTARQHLSTLGDYGEGQGPGAFVRHLWRVAIPTKGVNNEFDYPLGMPWLLFLVFLAFALARGQWRNPVLLLALLFWALWWGNAHQSRWLYPTLAFGLLGTLSQQHRVSVTLPVLLLISSLLSFASEFRALSPSFRKSAAEIQAEQVSRVEWQAPHVLKSNDLLYVNEPAIDHAADNGRWILR